MKYYNYDIVFSEIPGETTLAINISGCPNKCPDCHSKFLWKDVGEELTDNVLHELINKYPNITCVALMGGDQDYKEVERLLVGYTSFMAWVHPNESYIKTAWYSGKETLPEDMLWQYIDYIKLGPYIEKYGPLNSKTTNQRLYKVEEGQLIDITSKFWKNDS